MSGLAVAKTTLRQSVFGLYRSFLRAARAKDPDGARGLVASVKNRFRDDAAGVSRNEFQRIEYMLREGHKKLRMLGMSRVSGFEVRGGGRR